MGYIEKDLIPGEKILFKTRLHSVVLIRPILEAIVFCVFGGLCIWGARNEKDSNPTLYKFLLILAVVLFVAALARVIYGFVKRNSTEIAVTNRRVLIKWGLASRRTLEILLAKVESISVLGTHARLRHTRYPRHWWHARAHRQSLAPRRISPHGSATSRTQSGPASITAGYRHACALAGKGGGRADKAQFHCRLKTKCSPFATPHSPLLKNVAAARFASSNK